MGSAGDLQRYAPEHGGSRASPALALRAQRLCRVRPCPAPLRRESVFR